MSAERRRFTAGRLVALTLSATMGSAAFALTAPAIAHSDPASCADTFNVFVPGTWETNESADPNQRVGLLAPVADALLSKNSGRAEVYFVPYMARAFDNGRTYADSKATGVTGTLQVLEQVAAQCQNTKFTMSGYSQGADIAGDIASAIGNGRGPVSADRVLGVGLVADPGAGTKGSIPVGPPTSGKGIADPRPQGMGALSGRVSSICDPADLYCSINKGQNPLLSSIGTVLSKSPSANGAENVGGSSQLATALTSNFSSADLPGLAEDVASLGTQLTSPTVDLGQVVNSASSIANTLTPLADLFTSGVVNPAETSKLGAAPAGSPESSAAQVLDRAGQSDLSGALGSVSSLLNSVQSLTTAGTSTLPSNSPSVTELSTTADILGSQVAPVASTPMDALSSASSILSVLKPNVVIGQVLNVATGVTSLDLPGILNNLVLLPQRVAALDARGSHDIAGKLNNQFAPLVKLAAGVDLKWVSEILSVIPDPSGYTKIAAMVVNILSSVDIIKLANLVGQIQEIGWAAVEKLFPPPGQLPDLAGAVGAMAGLLPVGLDLASVAMNMLTGKATKTSPTLLGQKSTTVNNITTQAQNFDLPGLTGSLSTMAQSQGATDLVRLVGEGLTAANFYTSKVHEKYGGLVVDNVGRTAIQWLSDWLNLLIGRAA